MHKLERPSLCPKVRENMRVGVSVQGLSNLVTPAGTPFWKAALVGFLSLLIQFQMFVVVGDST